MHILGLSAYYHDSAACLLRDGEIVAAAQEERFTRIKHDANFPKNAIAYCLSEARITGPEIDYVVFYDKPFSKFERLSVATFQIYLHRTGSAGARVACAQLVHTSAICARG